MSVAHHDARPFGAIRDTSRAVLTTFWTVWRDCWPPKRPSNGPFWDREGVKAWPTTCFFKADPGPSGVLKHAFRARFEAVCGRLAPKPLEMPHFGIKRGSKRGKNCVPRQVILATPQDAQTHVSGRCGTNKGSTLPGKTLPHVKSACPLQLRPNTQSWSGLGLGLGLGLGFV